MAQSHYINKLKLEVTAPRSADGFALQSAMSQRFWQSVVPALSAVFDRFVTADEVIKIDRLDIDLSRIPLKDWETALTPSVCRAIEAELERALRDVVPTSMLFKGLKVEKQSVIKSQFQAWIYFLETGQLPQTASLETDWRQAALNSVAANAPDVEILRGLLRRDKITVERLVLQHDEPFLITLAEAISGRKQAGLKMLRETFEAVLTADYFVQLMKEATHNLRTEALPTARDMEVMFWQSVFEQLAKGVQVIDSQSFTTLFLLKILMPILRNDYTLFLKTLIAWEKTGWHDSRDVATTPSVKTAIEGNSLEKQTTFVADESLVIAPHFIQFIKTKAASTETATLLILFFEKEIHKHKAAIQQLAATAFVQKTKPYTAVLTKEMATPKTDLDNLKRHQSEAEALSKDTIEPKNTQAQAEEEAADVNKVKQESNKEKMADAPKTDDTNVNTAAATIEKEEDEDTATGQKTNTIENNNQKTDDFEPDIETALDAIVPKITSVIAPNAGIVLLHPFIKPFFEGLDLLRGGKFVDRKAQRRAAAILHYLATGKTEMAEYDMAMPKLLVGLSLERPVDRRIVLTDLERTEADDLLKAVIKHWKSLGDTSPDGLRDGFLKRTGKLTHRSDGWLLLMEGQTLDILLDRLPWGFSIVQLSWMKEMLFVEGH
jgi:hypothetical protein